MPSTLGNFTLSSSAVVSIFGDYSRSLPRPDASMLPMIGRRRFHFASDETSPLVIFDDEPIQVTSTLRLRHNYSDQPPFGIVQSTDLLLPTFSLSVKPVIETSSNGTDWQELTSFRHQQIGPINQWKDIQFSKRIRLPRGILAFRVCAQLEYKPNEAPIPISVQLLSPAYSVSVRQAPSILTFIAMGGSSSLGSSSAFPGHIETRPEECDVDPELIEELMTDENVECNNLCAECISFIEYLGLRALNQEGVANLLESLHLKQSATDSDYCSRRFRRGGISHRVVLGKWENSEHEPFRPIGIKTFEEILDEYAERGGHLLIVAQSHAGAKLAATVSDKWRWGDAIKVALFVSWDATHLGGGITSVGSRPQRVVNFFQTADALHFQNGSSIQEADLEFNLTGCFSHSAIARSRFVHQTTYNELRTSVAKIRTSARG